MSKVRIQPITEGFREMLYGEVGQAAVKEAGERVLAAAESAVSGLKDSEGNQFPVEGRLDTDGRPSYFVGIPHPGGLGVEAKHRPLGSALSGG